jgi:predicted TPR repeat methyltransferase
MSARNKLCTCGSGKLYRKCCGKNEKNVAGSVVVAMVELPNGQQMPVEQVIQSAMSLHQAGRLRRAAELYRRVLVVRPKHADALHLLGVAERQLGNFSLAGDLIRSAIAVNPRVALYHSNLGQLYCVQKEAEKAVASCRRAIELDANLPEAYLNLGNALRQLKKFDEATKAFDHALQLRPGYIDALTNKGEALQEAGKHEDALACFRSILELQPDSVAGLTRVGMSLRVQGRIDEAILHYKNAIQKYPNVPMLHYNLSMLYHKTGRLDEAISGLRRLLEMTPDDAAAQHLVATFEGKTTETAPAEYVRDLFDMYSDTFESHLVNKLRYQMPELIADVVKNHWKNDKNKTVMDLGCGTGLFGVEIAGACSRLVGVDLSPKMVEKAREKNVYTELVAADVLAYMKGCLVGVFDLVAAADVFVYIGMLDEIFSESQRVLKSGGLFAFTVEGTPDDSKDFMLGATGRYKHSAAYLRRLAKVNGMDEVHFSNEVIRYEQDQPVNGYLCVFAVLKSM